jgi:hypothetical protein
VLYRNKTNFFRGSLLKQTANIDVGLFSSCSHVIIKTQKVDPCAEGGERILIKESDRDEVSLEKSSTDNLFR